MMPLHEDEDTMRMPSWLFWLGWVSLSCFIALAFGLITGYWRVALAIVVISTIGILLLFRWAISNVRDNS